MRPGLVADGIRRYMQSLSLLIKVRILESQMWFGFGSPLFIVWFTG